MYKTKQDEVQELDIVTKKLCAKRRSVFYSEKTRKISIITIYIKCAQTALFLECQDLDDCLCPPLSYAISTLLTLIRAIIK